MKYKQHFLAICTLAMVGMAPSVVFAAVCNGLNVTVDLNLGQKTTPDDDVVLGTPGSDDIRGKAGNDTICGMGGDDFIHGNSGDDWIEGGDGVDNLRGGRGNDTIHTGTGATVGTASRAFGGYDDDYIVGGADDDDLRGGRGNDMIQGGDGSDVITGNEDNDYLIGGPGGDTLNGGGGDNDRCDAGDDAGDSEENCEYIVLTQLAVTGTEKSLTPAFSQDTMRYSLVAEFAPGTLSLIASASDSAVISVNGNLAVENVPFELTGLAPGDTITVTVNGGSGQEKVYEILYLPSDFPDLLVTNLTEDVAAGDIYLTLKRQGNQPNSGVYAAIIDNNGVPKFYRDINRGNNFRRQANGQYSYSTRLTNEQSTLGRRPFEHVVLDANFNEVGRYRAVGLQNTDFHEFLLKANGNAVFLAYEPSVQDLTPFGGSATGDVEVSIIQEVQAGTDNILTEWNSWGKILYEDRLRDVPYDYAHINAFQFLDNGNFIVTARGTSQLSMVDGATGNILWTLGGKSNQFTYVNDPFSNLCGPHTGYMVDANRVLIFDNGQYCWPENPARGELTRVVEYELDFTTMEAELIWSFSQAGNYTAAGGSSQRLDNGNTLIGWARGSNVLVTEVDANGNKTFELEATYSDGAPATSYRAYRF